MRPRLKMLALFVALLLAASVRATSVRADEAKTRFMSSLAVPLSRAEARQLESLLKAEKTATDASEETSHAWSVANMAADQAAPADAALLRKKAEALWKKSEAASARFGVANDALQKFKASKRARMPRALRRSRPAGATTVYLGRHRMTASGEPMLVHLWTAGRRAGEGANYAFEPSPFHLDVFQAAKGKRSRQWRRVATTVYQGDSFPDPDDVKVRYLRASTKQSPVLVLVSPVYMSTLYTVITYPGGFGKGKKSCVQEFSQGGVGGGKIIYDFGVDGRGMMTVVNTNSYAGRIQSVSVLAWNGREYAQRVAAKP